MFSLNTPTHRTPKTFHPRERFHWKVRDIPAENSSWSNPPAVLFSGTRESKVRVHFEGHLQCGSLCSHLTLLIGHSPISKWPMFSALFLSFSEQICDATKCPKFCDSKEGIKANEPSWCNQVRPQVPPSPPDHNAPRPLKQKCW